MGDGVKLQTYTLLSSSRVSQRNNMTIGSINDRGLCLCIGWRDGRTTDKTRSKAQPRGQSPRASVGVVYFYIKQTTVKKGKKTRKGRIHLFPLHSFHRPSFHSLPPFPPMNSTFFLSFFTFYIQTHILILYISQVQQIKQLNHRTHERWPR